MTKLDSWILAVATCIALMTVHVAASDWPNKPVRIIVPYSAGGANDLIGRTFGDVVGEALGQSFFVENRTGGAGIVGSTAVARAQPDGYTLLASGMPSLVLSPAMTPTSHFDSMKDFTHIAYLGGPPNVLVVHPDLGIKTFKDFVEMAKKIKEGVQYVSPSIGSVGNMVAEYLSQHEKLNLTHVAYKGGGSAIFDLVAGHVKVGCMTFSTTRPHIEAGKLIPLAVSTEERLPGFPDLPTMKELGFPEMVTATWYAMSGPADLPKEIVIRLNQEINKSLAHPRVKKIIALETLQTQAMTPEEVTAYIKSEINKWSPIAKELAAKK